MAGKPFKLRLEEDLYEPLKQQAARERRSVASLLNFLAAQYIESQTGKEIQLTVQNGGDRRSKAFKQSRAM